GRSRLLLWADLVRRGPIEVRRGRLGRPGEGSVQLEERVVRALRASHRGARGRDRLALDHQALVLPQAQANRVVQRQGMVGRHNRRRGQDRKKRKGERQDTEAEASFHWPPPSISAF